MYFVYKPGIKSYVYLFDTKGRRIGALLHSYAKRIPMPDDFRLVITFDRVNEIRRLNGLKELKV